MPMPQAALFVQGLRAQEHLEFDLRPGVTVAQIRAALAQLDQGDQVQASLVGYGDRLWRLLAPAGEVPDALAPLQPIHGTAGTMPVTQHDFWLWLQDRGPDVTVDAARRAVDVLAPVLTLVEDTVGFAYHDNRDLTGFVDGTENPALEEAVDVAVIAEGAGAGGSFALVQRWRHDLPRFLAQPVPEQERVIGRTKLDSVELDDLPATSHVARMVVETDEGELQIWRRSVPWGSARANGLLFVGFSADPGRFDLMLQRMYGATEDGVSDRLLQFSRPETGSLYFVPSLEDARRWSLP